MTSATRRPGPGATVNGRVELTPAALMASATFHSLPEPPPLDDANAGPSAEEGAGFAVTYSGGVCNSCAAAGPDNPSASATSTSRPAGCLPPDKRPAPGRPRASRPRRLAPRGSGQKAQVHRATSRMNLSAGILGEVALTSSTLASRHPARVSHSRPEGSRSLLKNMCQLGAENQYSVVRNTTLVVDHAKS